MAARGGGKVFRCEGKWPCLEGGNKWPGLRFQQRQERIWKMSRSSSVGWGRKLFVSRLWVRIENQRTASNALFICSLLHSCQAECCFASVGRINRQVGHDVSKEVSKKFLCTVASTRFGLQAYPQRRLACSCKRPRSHPSCPLRCSRPR